MSADLERLAAGEVWLPADAPEPIVFAAEELRAYLARLFGRVPTLRTASGPGGPWLVLAPAGTAPPTPPDLAPELEWAVEPLGEAAAVVGATPRALLAGAYALLASAGCGWSPFGHAHEHVPAPGEARRAVVALAGRAAFARRVYAADLATWHYTVPARLAARLPADVSFVDWMAKSGATGFLFIRHANDTQWVVPELVPELRRRGLAVEGGGHALVELVPRGLFADHPEYFPLGPAGRSDLGNACVSSHGALATVREQVCAARDAIPGAGAFHLWGLDLLGGGWCACAGCARLAASDQALLVCNEAAAALGDAGCIFHLAYHDTIDPPAAVRPHPRVWAEFAPRERCYAHPLDDPGCSTNRPYRRALEAHLACFDGRVDVFEYYGDAILFGGCAVPLAEVVARDLAFYRSAGVRGVSCLVFGRYSLWAYGVNVEAFARGALEPAAARDARASWSAARFGAAAAPMGRYLRTLERLMAGVARYGDLLLPPSEPGRVAAVRAGIDAVLASASDLRALLDEAASADAAAVASEGRLLAYTLEALTAVREWLDAGGKSATRERALAALFAAARHVREAPFELAGSWGRHDLEVTQHFFAGALRARAA